MTRESLVRQSIELEAAFLEDAGLVEEAQRARARVPKRETSDAESARIHGAGYVNIAPDQRHADVYWTSESGRTHEIKGLTVIDKRRTAIS